MSRIYFHSESGTSEIRGSERAYFGTSCSDLALAMFHVDFHDDRIQYLLPPGGDPFDPRTFRTWFSVGLGGQFHLPDGRQVDPFTVALNTAVVLGNDVVKFMARVHGQCEIHGFIEGPDRAWFAALIEKGRASKLLRADMGWESLITFLRARNDEPVVTSYSVCQQFPNFEIAGWEDDKDGEGFYNLAKAEQWARGLAALRASAGDLRWNPKRWNAFIFGDGITVMHLREIADALSGREERLARLKAENSP
jgi:hypothetical protein